ncbi:MAG TPA: hypothetical protein VG228_03970 [Solirubrobacteraceae bacterium]|jgi:hypothetical protein|nr:hypothetical protein [Solirubrobacteraceae bacterium]
MQVERLVQCGARVGHRRDVADAVLGREVGGRQVRPVARDVEARDADELAQLGPQPQRLDAEAVEPVEQLPVERQLALADRVEADLVQRLEGGGERDGADQVRRPSLMAGRARLPLRVGERDGRDRGEAGGPSQTLLYQ